MAIRAAQNQDNVILSRRFGMALSLSLSLSLSIHRNVTRFFLKARFCRLPCRVAVSRTPALFLRRIPDK